MEMVCSVIHPQAILIVAGGKATSVVTGIGQTYELYDAEGRVCASQSTPIPGITSPRARRVGTRQKNTDSWLKTRPIGAVSSEKGSLLWRF